MAVYHLACRLVAEPTRTNPPARVAKWQQACALPSCDRMIWKGDTISCTRDNENGHRKGACETTPAPVAIISTQECEEDAPATERVPTEARIREIAREEMHNAVAAMIDALNVYRAGIK